uniref:C-type lectin domain-containing protein n=1 Tax=Plectus sambesii TaxID=2011161 RepID=A0A914X4D9_9BILA
MVITLLLTTSFFSPVGADVDLEKMCTKETLTTALWTYFFQGTCYATHGSEIDRTMSYYDAKDACNDISGLTGHLGVFPDNFATLFPFMPAVFTVAVDFTLFIGLEQHKKSEASEPGKQWYWVFPDGSKTTLSSGFWVEGQPADSNGTKNVGAFMRRGNAFGLGNVDADTPIDGYVCQYDLKVKKGQIESSESPELDPAPMNSTGHPGTTGSNNNVTQNNSIESYTNNTVPGNNTIVLGNSTRLEAETTAAWNVTTIPLSNIIEADMNLERMCTKETLTTALWTYFFQGTCYATHGSEIDMTMSYSDAKDACNDIPGLTGHLAVFPDNFAEYFPLMRLVFTVPVDFTLFMGAKYKNKSSASEPGKEWYWLFPDGSKTVVSSGFWMEGQPDDS